jgi:hypothetical protein
MTEPEFVDIVPLGVLNHPIETAGHDRVQSTEAIGDLAHYLRNEMR